MPVSTSRILDMMDDVIYSERYADISFTCSYPMDTDSKDDHKITIMIVRYSEPFGHKHDFFRIYPGDEQYDVIFNVLKPYIFDKNFPYAYITDNGDVQKKCVWNFRNDDVPSVAQDVMQQLRKQQNEKQEKLQGNIPGVVDNLAAMYS